MTTKSNAAGKPPKPKCRVCRRPLVNRFFVALKVGPTCARGLSDEDLAKIANRLEPVQLTIDFEKAS